MGINEVIGETFGIVAEWLCSESHVSCCLKTNVPTIAIGEEVTYGCGSAGGVSLTQVVDK